MAQGFTLPPLNVKNLTPAGTTQATATPIKAGWSPGLLLVNGTAVGGILLPPGSKGLWFFLKNTGTTQLALLWVYPASGQSIDNLSANAFLQMGPQTSIMLIADGAGKWHTFPTVPS